MLLSQSVSFEFVLIVLSFVYPSPLSLLFISTTIGSVTPASSGCRFASSLLILELVSTTLSIRRYSALSTISPSGAFRENFKELMHAYSFLIHQLV